MTPHEAAKGLGRAQKAHIKHGIGGAKSDVLNSLERRGIVQESERKPGYLELSPLGLCVRTMLRGYDPEGMSDEQRIAYYRLELEFAYEWDECDRHPGHGAVYQWAWEAPKDGDHESVISGSETVVIASCHECAAEDEDRYQDE